MGSRQALAASGNQDDSEPGIESPQRKSKDVKPTRFLRRGRGRAKGGQARFLGRGARDLIHCGWGASAAALQGSTGMSSAAGDEAAGRSMQVDGEDDHRAYIFEFFRSHNAYDLLPESGKVLLLDSSVSAYSAFCILSANEQDAAPVWDARTEKYMGMVTLTDMLELVNICQNSKVFTSCLEGMKEMTLDNWMTSYPRPPGCPDISVEAHPDDDLMVVLKTLVRNDCRGELLSTHPLGTSRSSRVSSHTYC